ncbi:MAG: helix-turn-helix transcriptional regulator [Balneolaceae bacterium]|nr:helix-turn-helix transcriptional regulator [Balneolaceae bacterium]
MHVSYNYSEQLLTDYKNEVWNSFSEEFPARIECTLKYIFEHLYDESLTIADIKNTCNIKSKSFSAKFSLYAGITPKKFILKHRINAGKILLRETDLTIAQVSLFIGFSSHSAFSKAFIRDAGGITPSSWIEKIQGKVQ